MTNKFYRKDAIINVYVANIAKYNNDGNLVGGWVSLPIKKKDFRDFLITIGSPKRIGINDCYVNNSAFNGFKIEDYKGIQELNEVCKRMERIDPYKVNIFNALYEALGDFESALYCLEADDYVFYENMTIEEIAKERFEECFNIPSALGMRIDYSGIAHDMRYDGYYDTKYGVIEIL